MSDPVIISVVGSLTTTLGIIVVAWINAKQRKESTQQNKEIVGAVQEYHKEVNGKMGELLKVTGEAENAKGFKKGKEEKNKK